MRPHVPHSPSGRLAALLALILLAACSSGAESEAEKTVHRFYEQMNAGNYAEAMALYSAEAREVFEDPQEAPEAIFREFAQAETKSGTVEDVEVVATRETDNGTEVDFQVRYGDGSSLRSTVVLTEEAGAWKMGLVRRAAAAGA